MGVHGLWTLLEPVGKPVPLESLENKILAVDVSIWLHQATKGFRDSQGNSLPNAHLLGLCHRLCKLLYFKIKPVFVFDGGVPILKRQTMALRHSRRDAVVKSNTEVADKILSNYIKSELIHKKLDSKDGKPSIPIFKKRKQVEPDLFELPPMPTQNCIEEISESGDESSSDLEGETDQDFISFQIRGKNLHNFDFSSEAFRALPVEVQHEILLELRDTRKQSSWNRMDQMPQEGDGFSGFQMERLLKRRNLQQRLDEVVKEIGRKNHDEFSLCAEDTAESHKIVSDKSTHYVLIKKGLSSAQVPVMKTESSILQKEITPQKRNMTNAIPASTSKSLEANDEFSQEELFAILNSEKNPNTIFISSSSEDSSDLEEVISPVTSDGAHQIVFDIQINPESINKEDDMFADIFGPQVQLIINNSSNLTQLGYSATELKCFDTIDKNSDVPVPKQNFTYSIFSNLDADCNDVVVNFGSEGQIEMDQSKSIKQIDESQSAYSKTTLSGEELYSEPSSVAQELESIKTPPPVLMDQPVPSPDANSFPTKHSSSAENKDSEFKDYHELHYTDESICVESLPVNDGDATLMDVGSKEDSQSSQPKKSIKSNEDNYRQVISPKRREELEELGKLINQEQSALIQQHGRQERLASSITDQMYADSQELLRLFGIPYLIAPMEAEAQCAFLDEAGLTQGTITDDSDIWLFGGRRVYKNFFQQRKYVEFFESEDITKVFKLGREKLIHLALLTGSDYTEGIQGVGPVGALEILAEFPGQGLESLERFRDWLKGIQSKKNAPPENKIRQKIRNLQIKPGIIITIFSGG